jgi:hypothetical protein
MGYRSVPSTTNPNYEYFDGVLDEVRVYNKALTYTEIKNIYTGDGGTLPSTANCISGVLAGDLNEDCYVNMEDLAVMAGSWLKTDGLTNLVTAVSDIYPQPPLDADGTVDTDDLLVMAGQWLDCVDPNIGSCL